LSLQPEPIGDGPANSTPGGAGPEFVSSGRKTLKMLVWSIAGEKTSAATLNSKIKDRAGRKRGERLCPQGHGHWLMEERPEETTGALVDFL